MSPSDRMRLYAAVGEPGGSASNGVYNTNDGGMSWSPAGDFPIGMDNGRISVAAAPSAPGTLYAAVAGSGKSGSSFGRLYRLMKTTDGGATWLPDRALRPDGEGTRAGRRNYYLPPRGTPVHRQADQASPKFRQPGCDRHREHAAAQRAARIPPAADRHRRRSQGHQPLYL